MAARSILARLRLDWPLLGKELLEQASRKQTYVMRVTYALLLFGAFCFYYVRNLSEGPVLTLGRGLGPFKFLVTAQQVAIYLFHQMLLRPVATRPPRWNRSSPARFPFIP